MTHSKWSIYAKSYIYSFLQIDVINIDIRDESENLKDAILVEPSPEV